jgi:hypothetical protein
LRRVQGGTGGLAFVGAKGAEAGGDFTLRAGETLLVAVGGQGGNNGGLAPGAGGGGGSFVMEPFGSGFPAVMPLVVAGAAAAAARARPE